MNALQRAGPEKQNAGPQTISRLEVWIDDNTLGGSALVGHLQRAISRTGETISFEYAPQWLGSGGPVAGFPLGVSRLAIENSGNSMRIAHDPDKDHHVLAINEADPSPDTGLLLATADYYRIPKKDVGKIAGQVRDAVRGWETRARALGASGNEISRMRAIIDPDR